MFRSRRVYASVLLVSFGSVLVSTRPALATDPVAPPRDSAGTHFWTGFLANYRGEGAGPTTHTLFIAGDVATSGTVRMPGTGYATTFAVNPGQVTTVVLPAGASMNAYDVVQSKGIEITAGAEVTVYGLDRQQYTTDAHLALPTEALGTDYRILAYGYTATFPHPSQLGIVATQAGTVVEITPSTTGGTRAAGVPYTLTLDAGQTYMLASGSGATAGDLTGSRVTANKPIAVFGGHECSSIPLGTGYCDHSYEQLPPTETWGTRFVTAPLATRTRGDTFRVLASRDGTTVTINGATVATLQAGRFLERVLTGGNVIEASQPVLVAQYSNGSQYDGVPSDPFMMLVPPHEQFLRAYTITTPASGFRSNFVNVVTSTSTIDLLELDGAPVAASAFRAIGASGFSYAQLSLPAGGHRLASTAPFGAFVYGFDTDDSYGYPAGFSLSPVASVASLSVAPEQLDAVVGESACVAASVRDSAGAPLGGIRVDVATTGANVTGGSLLTDAAGIATYCYEAQIGGTDTVTARIGRLVDSATVRWGYDLQVELNALAQRLDEGQTQMITATVRHARNGALARGIPVLFTVTGTHPRHIGNTTGGDGTALLNWVGERGGIDDVTVVAGNASASIQVAWRWRTRVDGRALLEADPMMLRANVSPGLAARLTRHGAPLVGKTVVFEGDDGDLCSAITDADGVATCSEPIAIAIAVSETAYSMRYDGDAEHMPAVSSYPVVFVPVPPPPVARI